MKRFTQDGLSDEIAGVFDSPQDIGTFRGAMSCCLNRCLPPVIRVGQFLRMSGALGQEFEYLTREQASVGADPTTYVFCALPMLDDTPQKVIEWMNESEYSTGYIRGSSGTPLPIMVHVHSKYNRLDAPRAVSFEWAVDPSFRLERADFATLEEAKAWAEMAVGQFATMVGEEIWGSETVRAYVVERGDFVVHRKLRTALPV